MSRSLSRLVALVFLVSGYAKAADAAYFSDILWNTYAVEWIAFAAPLLILAELLLGWMLLLGGHRRVTAAASIVLLAMVTAGYLWGVAEHGMYDCGCFGHLEALNLPPVWTVVRNGVLMAMLIPSVLPEGVGDRPLRPVGIALLVLGMTVGAAVGGYTFRNATVIVMHTSRYTGCTVRETPLARLGLSPDSTYLVFCFSYHCPHCQNAVGNVRAYAETGVVDRTIGLAAADSMASAEFRAFYGDLFPVTDLDADSLLRIADALPTAYFVMNDTVLATWRGTVPPAIYFRDLR